MVDSPSHELDLREQIAHIDQMLADIARKRQEVQLAPWQIALAAGTTFAGALAAGAGLFAVGAAWVKVLGH